MPAGIPRSVPHCGQLGFKSRHTSGEQADDGEAEILADRLKLAALAEGHKNAPAVRAYLLRQVPILETLIDHRNVESELGLDADLETILDAHQEDVPVRGLGIDLPVITMLASDGCNEG